MKEMYDNDPIYREIQREIRETEGNYNVNNIIKNLEPLGFTVGISSIESRIKTYLSDASKDIKEMVKKAKEVKNS